MSEATQGGELLPCPFCGARGDVKLDRSSNGMWRVLCANCGASSFKSAIKHNTVASWNERAPLAAPASVPAEVLEAIKVLLVFAEEHDDLTPYYGKEMHIVATWLAQQG